MVDVIRLKRSYVAGVEPTPSELSTHEVCINYADNKLFVKTPTGQIQSVSLGAEAAASPVQSVAGRTGAVTLTKSDVGLSNVPNADATARENHTGTQAASTISDFATEAAKYGPVLSVNGQTGVVTISGGGSSVSLSDSTPSALGTAAAGTSSSASRADHTHSLPTASALGLAAVASSGKYADLSGVPLTFAPSNHTHTVSEVSGLQDALDGKQASGSYATLVDGLVPSAQLPSYVDDVLEYASLAEFPAAGEAGKIYVNKATNKTHRWSGTAYIEISPSPGSTDSVPEGSVNLYFTTSRASSAAPVQSVASRTGAVTLTKSDVGLSNVPNTDATSRANHTGTQTASTISDFATEAAKYGPVVSVAGRTGAVTLTKSDVGLSSVPNADATARENHTGTQTASTISDFATEAAKYGPVVSVAGRTGTVTLAQLGSAGVAASTTFLRGDGAWASPDTTDASLLKSGTVAPARLPLATTTAAGAVVVGSGLTITNGVLAATSGGSYQLPIASNSVLGGVKVGYGLTISQDGVLSLGQTIIDMLLPPAPTNVSATAGTLEATVSWTAPTVPSQMPITDYAIQKSTDNGSTWATVSDGTSTSASAVVAGLTAVAHKFRVAAVNAIGQGPWSAASSSVTPEAGVATITVQPKNDITDGETYTAPTFSVTTTGTVTSYEWQFRAQDDSNEYHWYSFLSGGTSSTLTITDMDSQMGTLTYAANTPGWANRMILDDERIVQIRCVINGGDLVSNVARWIKFPGWTSVTGSFFNIYDEGPSGSVTVNGESYGLLSVAGEYPGIKAHAADFQAANYATYGWDSSWHSGTLFSIKVQISSDAINWTDPTGYVSADWNPSQGDIYPDLYPDALSGVTRYYRVVKTINWPLTTTDGSSSASRSFTPLVLARVKVDWP